MVAEYLLNIKRVYDEIAETDGMRFLTDRIWPIGVKKTDLVI